MRKKEEGSMLKPTDRKPTTNTCAPLLGKSCRQGNLRVSRARYTIVHKRQATGNG